MHAPIGPDPSMNPADYEVGKKTMIPLVKITDAEIAAAKHRQLRIRSRRQSRYRHRR